MLHHHLLYVGEVRKLADAQRLGVGADHIEVTAGVEGHGSDHLQVLQGRDGQETGLARLDSLQ